MPEIDLLTDKQHELIKITLAKYNMLDQEEITIALVASGTPALDILHLIQDAYIAGGIAMQAIIKETK